MVRMELPVRLNAGDVTEAVVEGCRVTAEVAPLGSVICAPGVGEVMAIWKGTVEGLVTAPPAAWPLPCAVATAPWLIVSRKR